MECPKCHFDNPDNTKFCGYCATPLLSSDETMEVRTETVIPSIPDWKTGSTLAQRYEIIEELGKGGMGKVYKAFDREINEKIALKIIRPEIAANKNIIARFRNELRIARKISHRNVCRMFDLGKDGETKYITMELVSGEDLKKTIRRMGPFTIRKTLFISKQICHGLSEAHQLGVVHRDLKPHNIMIDKEGNVRIMDFGIALSREASGITDSGVLVGTPQYMSPEQVEGKETDHRTDIYSLGVILFEMVTGQVPFDGETTLNIAFKHKTELPRDPKGLNVQIPDEFSRLILKCLEKDPNKRYQSVEELCSDLMTIEQEIPTSHSEISHSMVKSRFPVLRSLLSRSGLSIVSVLLMLSGSYFIYTQFFKKESPDAGPIRAVKQFNTLVVLPFKDLSPQKEEDPISLIVTDALIVNLHVFKGLRVLGTTTALAYQDSKKDVHTIGRELNADLVLGGTILRSEGLMRINAQLCSVEDQSVIWAKTFENKQQDFQKIQDVITLDIAQAIGISGAEEVYRSHGKEVSSILLSDKNYNRGRHFEISYHYSGDPQDFEKCVENYLKVVEANPNDAHTFWRLGNVHENRFNDDRTNKKCLDLMFAYYQKAYDLDPHSAETNVGLGWSYFYKENNDKAYRYFQTAHDLDPKNAELNFYIGSFFRSIGLYEQAVVYYSTGFELDPMPFFFSLWNDLRADCISSLGRFEEAAALVQTALKIQPDRDLYLNYAWQLLMMHKMEDAGVFISLAEKLDPDSRYMRYHKAWLFAAQGDKAEALRLIEGEEQTFRYLITNTYSALDMKNEAVANIKKGIDVAFDRVGMYFYSYPFLVSNIYYDNLRNDPRFQKILQAEKKKYEEKMAKYKVF
ncbi:MAG: protein kinase [Candidatus Aminicenantes bacterium]|nr:protein kinase [Candidatus Aminicenantes bacterium]